VTVAETRTLTEAAARLCLTRSAVSHALKSLETEVGCALFDRTNKSLSLTSRGRQLLPYARKILDTMRDARDELMASG
jgi:DNA-binding transcriptional LysR family regulator